MTGNKKTRESVKNIYDENTGFAVMVNLYTIKYLYYHIDKASCFIDSYGSGKKCKAYPIYSTKAFPISRQRLDRINKGIRFEITRSEANSIIETYGINIKYFRKEEPVQFAINAINDTDWRCFYNQNYDGGYELPQDIRDKKEIIKSKADNVKKTLKGIAVNWKQVLEKTDPLYAICYYFHFGCRYDEPDNITRCREILSVLDFTEWDTADNNSLREIYQLMKDHYQYIGSLLALEKLRSKKFKKEGMQ